MRDLVYINYCIIYYNMLNLNKPRPFFGSSVTQNTQSDHDGTLRLYTGAGLDTIKKNAVLYSELYNKPVPNIKYGRDFSREVDIEASSVRNNELPFKQIRVNIERGTDKHLTGDFRYLMKQEDSRQSLPGMVPTGYSSVRKSSSLGAIYDTKKHAKRINDNLPGIRNFNQFKPVKVPSTFRETDKVTHYHVFDKNFSVENNNKKQTVPNVYRETDNTVKRINGRNDRSNIINKVGVTDHDYASSAGNKDSTHINADMPSNLSFPIKLTGTPSVEKSVRTYKTNTPVRKMAKFVNYEQYGGKNQTFKTKRELTSDYKTPGNRSFDWNNISPKVTLANRGTIGVVLPGHNELNKPDLDFENSLSGSKRVYDMTSTWKQAIPKKIIGIENINRTEA